MGHGLSVALGWCVGEARVLAPVALVVGGGALLLAQLMPTRRPLRTGGLCLFAAVTLALAAGTLGVAVAAHPRTRAPPSSGIRPSCRPTGASSVRRLYWVAHRMVQTVGVDILVVFLMVVGVVLLSGASLAAVLRATGNGLVDTSRVLRARASALEQASRGDLGRAHAGRTGEGGGRGVSVQPPEPAPEDLIVRATHVEAPSVDGLPPGLGAAGPVGVARRLPNQRRQRRPGERARVLRNGGQRRGRHLRGRRPARLRQGATRRSRSTSRS